MRTRILFWGLGAILAAVALAGWQSRAASRGTTDPEADSLILIPARGQARLDSVRRSRLGAQEQIAQADTYLPAMLAQDDSVLKRWPERLAQPLAVYLPEGTAAGYAPAMGRAAREAFARWQRVGDIPVTFQFTRDSSRADVVVHWIHQFPMQRAGQADVRWNGRGWLLSGRLTLATAYHGGMPLSPEAVYTVALHEIGHLLGLGHSDDPRDVMYPTTDVHDITPRDRRTARLLYALPPGSVRVP